MRMHQGFIAILKGLKLINKIFQVLVRIILQKAIRNKLGNLVYLDQLKENIFQKKKNNLLDQVLIKLIMITLLKDSTIVFKVMCKEPHLKSMTTLLLVNMKLKWKDNKYLKEHMSLNLIRKDLRMV